MRTALQCLAMAARMDSNAARSAVPDMVAEWTAMASRWRGLAHQGDWQDSYVARRAASLT